MVTEQKLYGSNSLFHFYDRKLLKYLTHGAFQYLDKLNAVKAGEITFTKQEKYSKLAAITQPMADKSNE